ncbi:hypothetical protein K435DRAFT_708645 [Dendrothele bispora CBS 962.96]|uniref:Vacuole protein n=1 Tax=Dendrothele bispora (strain CBS 962.96) TaxID=1314807 RepID=A0A4V4HJ01_DENBC|nr:hypothetical protein K435DRAFT_708645 [Dendrothele bispora CBS 962.96]
MCCGGPKWKREVVPDHKFDFVDTREFTDNGFMMRMKYLWLYIIVLKSFLVYISDISTAITMLTTSSWRNEIFNTCQDLGCVSIPYNVGKWLFVGCIIFSFLLLGYEARKAKKIIASRDISYAFTNVMANNYYSLRSYNHFCFFDHISNSTKTSDDFAFFVFFTFKSWKRVLLADGPRQTINALTLYAIFLAHKNEDHWYSIDKYFRGNSLSTSALTVTTFFTVAVFAGSLLLLIVAGICYVPLLMHIRGNLKEYCCHKVDKRISAVIKRKQKQRLADAAKLAHKEAMGDYSHLKNKKGELIGKPLPQPTLPNLSVDDDVDDAASFRTRGPPPSTYTQDYYNPDHGAYPPPMPAYNPYSQNTGSFTQINPSQPTLREDSLYNYAPQGYYDDDNDSVAHLAGTAAPIAGQGQGLGVDHNSYPNPYSPGPGNTSYDPHDVYQGHAGMTGSAYGDYRSHTPGHAYDDYRSHTPANGQHYGQQGNGYNHGPSSGFAV